MVVTIIRPDKREFNTLTDNVEPHIPSSRINSINSNLHKNLKPEQHQ